MKQINDLFETLLNFLLDIKDYKILKNLKQNVGLKDDDL